MKDNIVEGRTARHPADTLISASRLVRQTLLYFPAALAQCIENAAEYEKTVIQAEVLGYDTEEAKRFIQRYLDSDSVLSTKSLLKLARKDIVARAFEEEPLSLTGFFHLVSPMCQRAKLSNLSNLLTRANAATNEDVAQWSRLCYLVGV